LFQRVLHQLIALVLEVVARILVQLNAREERLEIACPEALVVLTLDHLDEECGSVRYHFGEDLQHLALVIEVHQDAQFAQHLQVLLDLRGTVLQPLLEVILV